MINIEKIGKGGLEKKVDLRDYRLEAIGGAGVLPTVFSLRDKISGIKHQGTSSSCGSQATAYYAQLLNLSETNEQTELSARDIYSKVFQPQGGQYVADCTQKVCDTGVVTESQAKSYKGGNPPDEAFMRDRADITPDMELDGTKYLSKSYVTWNNTSLDLFRQAIVQGNGCIICSWGNNYCWGYEIKNGEVLLPDNAQQMEWRHIVYLIGYDDNKKCFEFVNSWGNGWGDKGFGWLPYDYVTKGYVANPVTLIDLPNGTYSLIMKIIGLYKNIISMLKK